MRYISTLALGVMGLLVCTLAAWADDGKEISRDRSDRGRAQVRIVVKTDDEAGEARALQQFMGGHFRRYDTIDPETGERVSDLLQMVVDVNDGYILVSNQQDSRRTIVITRRTRVTFENIRTDDTPRPSGGPWWSPSRARQEVNRGEADRGNRDDRGRNDRPVANRIEPGDLLIAQGYLNSAGKFVGTDIRIVGHADGWYDEDIDEREGVRGWGEVRSIDRRGDRIEVLTNMGTRTVSLARNGEVLYRSRRIAMEDLDRGDRIVFYADATDSRTGIEAIRIVKLEGAQAYPRGNEPYWADPANWGEHGPRDGAYLEGNLDYISSGVLLHKLVMTGARGRSTTFLLSKSLKVIDRDGSRISLNSLREGEQLRVYYTEINGSYFATRIEAR